jgi:hypothetical protein
MLGAADLLSQMADRAYLERLLSLYAEFREANMGGYESEVDFLEKTVTFYDLIADRLDAMNVDIDRFLISHFKLRWGIEENLYGKAVQRYREYLQQILRIPNSDPLSFLRRRRIVEDVSSKRVER